MTDFLVIFRRSISEAELRTKFVVTFPNRLQMLREERGISLRALAMQVPIRRPILDLYDSERLYLTFSDAQQIGLVLGVAYWQLMYPFDETWLDKVYRGARALQFYIEGAEFDELFRLVEIVLLAGEQQEER